MRRSRNNGGAIAEEEIDTSLPPSPAKIFRRPYKRPKMRASRSVFQIFESGTWRKKLAHFAVVIFGWVLAGVFRASKGQMPPFDSRTVISTRIVARRKVILLPEGFAR